MTDLEADLTAVKELYAQHLPTCKVCESYTADGWYQWCKEGAAILDRGVAIKKALGRKW